MKKRDLIPYTLIFGITLIFIVMISGLFKSISHIENLKITGGERVGVLEIEGVIYDAQNFVKDLEKFLEIPSVKAMVIRIDSPGGSVAASQEIYSALKKAQEQLPIVVSMGNVAASGGYYAAVGADTIVANPGSTTGSIGVIAELTIFYRLMQKIGIDIEVIKSGQFKDTGSPFRQMTPEEKKYLQSWVDDTFEQFIQVVSEERKIPLKEVKKIADGRVFTGRQALKLGLVDVLGDFQDAVRIAGRMGGIKGKPQVLEKKKRKLTLFDILFGDVQDTMSRLNGSKMELKYLLP